jgi:large subunit ribosomal protein L4
MPTLQVIGMDNRPIETIEMEGKVFMAPANRSLVHKAVVMQRASVRQGTVATRGRGEVQGSNKKPWKQKHTGRARAGSARSPIWRHGGTAFGPKPRDFSFQMPRKSYRSALRSALSSKVSSNEVVVLSELSLPEPKARCMAQVLSQLELSGRLLIVVGDEFSILEKVARNLKNVKLIRVNELNVYDILLCDKLVILRNELMKVQEFWS